MDYTPKDTAAELEAFGDGVSMPGTAFSAFDQAMLLQAFQTRYTGDNVPTWAQGKTDEYPVQFSSDQDWLAHTTFAITPLTRRLDRRIKRCWEKPTWPGNPMVYGQPIKDLPAYVQMRFAPNMRTKGWVPLFNAWLKAFLDKEDRAQPVEMTLAQAIAENQRRAAAGLPSLADEEDAAGNG